MCDELTKKCKRSFSEAWLIDERYKSWICKVSFDSNMYYCNVCNKNYSCDSIHVSRHTNSACHKNNLENNIVHCPLMTILLFIYYLLTIFQLKNVTIPQHLKRNGYILSSSNVGYVKRHMMKIYFIV